MRVQSLTYFSRWIYSYNWRFSDVSLKIVKSKVKSSQKVAKSVVLIASYFIFKIHNKLALIVDCISWFNGLGDGIQYTPILAMVPYLRCLTSYLRESDKIKQLQSLLGIHWCMEGSGHNDRPTNRIMLGCWSLHILNTSLPKYVIWDNYIYLEIKKWICECRCRVKTILNSSNKSSNTQWLFPSFLIPYTFGDCLNPWKATFQSGTIVFSKKRGYFAG